MAIQGTQVPMYIEHIVFIFFFIFQILFLFLYEKKIKQNWKQTKTC